MELTGRFLPRRHPQLAGMPNTVRQGVARQQSRLAARLVSDPLVAIYNVPSKDNSTASHYFCEACVAYLPAREQDWQIHLSGIDHQSQILSLCGTGELGHTPLGDPQAMAGTWQHVLPGHRLHLLTRLLLQAPTSPME